MRNNLSITFKDTRHTDHLEQFIQNRFNRLQKFHPEIQHCNVAITTPHNAQQMGTPKQVRINIRVPGKTISARRVTSPGNGMDLYSAVSDAFLALEIQAESRIPGRINYKNFRKLSSLDALHTAG